MILGKSNRSWGRGQMLKCNVRSLSECMWYRDDNENNKHETRESFFDTPSSFIRAREKHSGRVFTPALNYVTTFDHYGRDSDNDFLPENNNPQNTGSMLEGEDERDERVSEAHTHTHTHLHYLSRVFDLLLFCSPFSLPTFTQLNIVLSLWVVARSLTLHAWPFLLACFVHDMFVFYLRPSLTLLKRGKVRRSREALLTQPLTNTNTTTDATGNTNSQTPQPSPTFSSSPPPPSKTF